MDERRAALCPSARPEMEGSVVFGIVGGSAEPHLVGYLEEPQPASAEVLAHAAPLKATSIFRFAAACAGPDCAHFQGADCRLVTKIVALLPPVVEVVPPCPIRRQCRWWQQEGRAACRRCPSIATEPAHPSEALRRAADPAIPCGRS